MRQTRLSIGCQDWQKTVKRIGPTAAGIFLYLRTFMRTLQNAEITISIQELVEVVEAPTATVEDALRRIVIAGYLEKEDREGDVITLRDQKEAAAQADMFRKRAARLLSRRGEQSGEADSPRGQSGVLTATSENLSVKQYTTDFFMIYNGQSVQKEKSPRTPEKEKTLTEFTGRASMHTRDREPELPADSLEAEYIDIVGSWPTSLRRAIRAEKDDIREAFYLFVRTRQTDAGKAWTADQVRIAWLAARRIPEARRADSILAAAMANWKTIRDVGSGMYFEKETGRIVSLVRGPIETRGTPSDQTNSKLAARLAGNMRRD